MSQWSENLELPYLSAAQAQKHVTHNEALELLDAIVQLSVVDFDATNPPVSGQNGAIWALGTGATNDWAGHDGELAIWSNGGWLFVTPKSGWRAAKGTELRVYDGNHWTPPALPDLQNLSGIGVSTSYDSTNKLAVASDASLFTHAGTSHQLKINKNTVPDSATMIFQSNWSGRAEMGLAGTDDFSLKVSSDGANWNTALGVDTATGHTTLTGLTLGAPLAPSQGGTGHSNPDGATLTRNGPHDLTLSTSANSSLTLPTAGTLATLDGAETLSAKTLLAPVIDMLVSGTAITQSATDATVGRLTKIGDFGLGGTTAVPLIADFNTQTTPAGFYRFASSSANRPAGMTNYGFLLVMRQAMTGIFQMVISQNAATILCRSAAGGTWGPWRRLTSERGSNSNGTYVRLADGTQICRKRVAGQGPINVATGAGFGSGSINLGSWPASFISPPQRHYGCDSTSAAAAWVRGIVPPTTSGAGIVGLCNFTPHTATDFAVDVIGIGRWY